MTPLRLLPRLALATVALAPGAVVALVCHTDKRSSAAVPALQAAGFADVRVLHRGMVRWTEAGLPVERI